MGTVLLDTKNNQKISNKNFKIPFIVSNYITSLILPKCVMVHGEVISSIYFQIAININNKKSCFNWQRNGCWIGFEKMSNNTGFNERTIRNAVKTLEELDLIQVTKNGKLNVYRLKNNNLKSLNTIIKFNNKVESILLKDMNKTKTNKYNNLFRKLELNVGFELSNNNQLLKNSFFSDINLLRQLIIESEQIYKGSTLFYIKNIAPYTLNKGGECQLLNISESDRAIRIGSSNSTVNRYINAYIEAGILTVTESGINKPNKLSIKNKSVVNVLSNDKKLTCPICKREFNGGRSLAVHLGRTNDDKHIMLNFFRKENKYDILKLDELYSKYEEEINDLKGINNIKVRKPKINDEYLKIPCSCTMSCKECHKNWTLDYYNDCDHERKHAYIKEYNIEYNKKEKLNNTIKELKVVNEKKKPNPDNTPSLLKYFYNLTNLKSPNWAKESGQIKNLLNKGVSPDDIRTTMDYLAKKGNIDLRFLNRSVQEALLDKQYMEDLNKEGTESYLVKMYYEGLGLPINSQTLVNDVRKIKETMNTGLSYEQTKLVVQYMIDIKCPTLNFIATKRTEALINSKKINSGKNNPCFYDRDDMFYIREMLATCRTRLSGVSEKNRESAKKVAREIFMLSEFIDGLTHLEWAWAIGIHVDEEMYKFALTQNNKRSKFEELLNDKSNDEKEMSRILKNKARFDDWVALLDKQYRGCM